MIVGKARSGTARGRIPKHVFELYIAGESSMGRQALANLKRILSQDFTGPYVLKVIDILKNPLLAEKRRINATPMVIKSHPLRPQLHIPSSP